MTKSQPRGKGKIRPGKNLADAYEILKDHFGTKIERKRFMKIAHAINKRIMEGIRNGEEFSMPYNAGTLRIKKYKVNYNNPRIDFNYYMKTGIKKKHLNEHSSGFYFGHKWDRNMANLANKFFYSFIPTRTNKKQLVSLVKSGTKGKRDYFE